MSRIRTGIGYDSHRLEKGRPLVLGGIEIPFARGLVGHSDGDVLIHAVIDALLGAMGEKDIGQCFPDTNPVYKNIRSTELLVSVAIELPSQSGLTEGVLVTNDVVVRKGNGEGYGPQFEQPLHEGVEFKVTELRDGWIHIELADGNQGWVREHELELF